MDSLDDRLQEVLEDWYPGTQYSDVIPLIKQAFIDAGWFIPSDAELVQQIVNYRMQQKDHTIKHVADFSQGKLSELMTGQEWYDKFSNELKYLVSRGDGEAWMGWDCGEVRDAAKKAAGIE